jgi:hypothetical protein
MPSRDEREQARRKPGPPPEQMTRLGVWFRADEMAALHALAAKQGRSEPALVREAVRRMVGLTKRQS